jgi:hypothetical protein
MDTVNISALNTSSFVFSRVLTPWADVYPLSSGKFRMHMRAALTDNVTYFEWSSDNRLAAYTQTFANGQLTFASNPSPGDTIMLGSSAVEFTTAGPTIVIAPSANVSVTLASPGVVSWTNHGLPAGTPIYFSTTGSFATGIAASTLYYISATGLTTNSFQFSATSGGASINTSGAQSGQLSCQAPSTVVLAAHGLVANTPVELYTTNTLPLPFSNGPIYYVLSSLLSTNSFQLATAPSGTPLIVSGAQSGTQSLIAGHVVSLGPQATVTFTLGTPGVINWTSHNLPAGTPVQFTSTGNLPAPLALGTIYYVSVGSGANVLATNSFTIAATYADSQTGLNDITLGGSVSGVQTGIASSTVSWTTHGLTPNEPVIFATTGTLPTPLVLGVKYYVLQPLIESSTFQVSATPGGAPVFFGLTQSGVQTATASTNTLPVGANLPQTLTNLLAMLNASTDPQISLATYSASGSGTLNVKYVNAGTLGNQYAIAASSTNVTLSGATLQGAGGILTLTAPLGAMANFLGNFVYDCRFESADGSTIVTLFGGTITFTQGVTRSGDTNMATLQLGPAVQLANLPTPIGDGELIQCSDLGGGPALLESAKGVWRRINEESFFARGDTFGNISLTVLKNSNIQMFTGGLTGNVVVSLTNVNTYPGSYFRVIAPGAMNGFSFTVQGQALTSGQYASFLWNGSTWQISGLGSY